MSRIVILGLFILLSAITSSRAQGYSFSGNDLLQRCDGPYANELQKLAYTSFCTGYLQGLQQMHSVVIGVHKTSALYCEPTITGSYDQLERVVIKWLKGNPEQLHRDARVLVTRAWIEAFPCQ